MNNTQDMLNAASMTDRLEALSRVATTTDITSVPFGNEVNNHVHTQYSFSPYSPTAVAYHARRAGLRVVGSVDHESIAAAGEMKQAAEIVGMGSTVGCEIRVSFAGTAFEARRLNNPDTIGNAYIVIHGVPSISWNRLTECLRPINQARERRNRDQVDRLNQVTASVLGELDYDRDVRSISWADQGGSVTERHILYALAHRVIQAVQNPARTATFLAETFGIQISRRVAEHINDCENPHRPYDLLGLFKTEFVPQFFIQPGAIECPPVAEITSIARELGAIPAYSYLGDVGESPTGDKKPQEFEDAFVDELFASLGQIGFQAVTYMPPRNTVQQLTRIQRLAEQFELLQVSGVDINSTRQSFHCPEVLEPAFRHLGETTWALVGHEIATRDDINAGFFSTNTATTILPLDQRIRYFAKLAREAVPAGKA